MLSTMMRGQGRMEKGEGRGNWISVLGVRGLWSWCLDGVLSCSSCLWLSLGYYLNGIGFVGGYRYRLVCS